MEWQFLPSFGVLGTVNVEEVFMQSKDSSLPDRMKEFVDGQIAKRRYSSASEYVRELIRTNQA